MSDAIKLIMSLSVSGGALALLLFALKRAFRDGLPKAFLYYVWLIVLLRLALPVSFGFSVTDSIFRSIPSARNGMTESASREAPLTGTFRPSEPILVMPGEEFSFNGGITVKPAQEGSIAFFPQAADYWLLVWIAGAVTALGINVLGYARFAVKLKKAHRSALPSEEQLLKRLHSGSVALKRNPLARTPMLMGFFRPVIVLPDKAYTHEQLIFVLEHELTHYRRLDIPLKWLGVLVCCAHWFNPLAYFIRREIDRACELSCDEAVIKALDAHGKQIYGETLISAVAPDRFMAALTTMCRDKATVKERLIAIMNYKQKSNAIKALSAALLMLVMIAAAALGACVPPAEEKPAAQAQPAAVPYTVVTVTPRLEGDVQTGTAMVTPAPDSDIQIYTAVLTPAPGSTSPSGQASGRLDGDVQTGTAMVTPTPESDVQIYTAVLTPAPGSTSPSGQASGNAGAQPKSYAFHIGIDEQIYITNDSGSEDVRALQTRLNELAETHPSIQKIAVNGEYDEATKAAIVEAQRVFGMSEDGIAGPDTWFAIAPFDGAAVFSEKSGEILTVKYATAPRFEEGDAAAAEDGEWIMIAPQGASVGAAQNGSADALVEIAGSKLGAPYIIGANGPEAFDDISFVNWCLKQAGSDASFHDAEAWAESDYPTIDALEDAAPGDILCFNGHIGICIGDGRMIDASSSQGKVRPASLDTQYWQRNFVCAKRVFG